MQFLSQQLRLRWEGIVEKNFGARCVLQLASLLCFAAAFVYTPHASSGAGFPFPWALVPVAGAACFISAGVSQASVVNRLVNFCQNFVKF